LGRTWAENDGASLDFLYAAPDATAYADFFGFSSNSRNVVILSSQLAYGKLRVK
jgi:hypothetical protein